MAARESEADREIIQTRVFEAPRALVYEAWTNAKHLDQWFGPKGFTTKTLEADIRVGGRWRFVMVGPDGKEWDNRMVYLELEKPSRIVCEHGSDKDDDPERFHVTVTFTEEGGKTKLVQRMLLATIAQKQRVVGFGAVELGKTTLEKLAEHLTRMAK
jgi:uncharacterized protein YndB with AHSA1/START domain